MRSSATRPSTRSDPDEAGRSRLVHPVNDDELIALREQVYDGSYQYQINEGELNVGDYLARLEEIKPETEAFNGAARGAERTPVPKGGDDRRRADG